MARKLDAKDVKPGMVMLDDDGKTFIVVSVEKGDRQFVGNEGSVLISYRGGERELLPRSYRVKVV